VRNEKGSDGSAKEEENFEAPESVLQMRSGIPRALDSDDGHDEADSVDGKVTDEIGARQLQDVRGKLNKMNYD
jgi:hypothetical protein